MFWVGFAWKGRIKYEDKASEANTNKTRKGQAWREIKQRSSNGGEDKVKKKGI